MTATALITRRYLGEYGRRPINLVLLVLVPLIFVVLAAGALADFAAIVGGVDDSARLAAPTAGWAAAFLAGVAGFFHVLGSRKADRRLSASGMGPIRIVAARMVSGLMLALLSAGTAIAALAVRTGIPDPLRAVSGTVMSAVIYLAIGVAIGALVKTDINGSLAVVFVWMIDVFLGPAMAGGDFVITRIFPTHFVTLVTLDVTSGHPGPIGDFGWALAWTIGALALSAVIFGSTTSNRKALQGSRRSPEGGRRLWAGFRYGLRDYRRNVAMWVMLIVLPIFFITLSFFITPNDPTPVRLVEGGSTSTSILSMIDLHGAIMVPITIAFLAGLAGLFVVQGSLEADGRLALAGFRSREILGARLGVIGVAAVVATGVSLAVTAVDFAPASWGSFAGANLLVAATYALVGLMVGALFGRLGGLYLMFLLPFIDVGLAQNPMLSLTLPGWGAYLPGRGAVRVLIDAAFTPSFDETGSLLLAFAWLAALGVATTMLFRRIAEPNRV